MEVFFSKIFLVPLLRFPYWWEKWEGEAVLWSDTESQGEEPSHKEQISLSLAKKGPFLDRGHWQDC